MIMLRCNDCVSSCTRAVTVGYVHILFGTSRSVHALLADCRPSTRYRDWHYGLRVLHAKEHANAEVRDVSPSLF